jgi:hypothetical protein
MSIQARSKRGRELPHSQVRCHSAKKNLSFYASNNRCASVELREAPEIKKRCCCLITLGTDTADLPTARALVYGELVVSSPRNMDVVFQRNFRSAT